MPDFKELNPILLNSQSSLPNLPNPSTPSPDDYMALGAGTATDLSGRTVDPIFGNGPIVSPMLPTATAQDLYENRRYKMFSADIVDPEDQAANAQAELEKATKGVLKGLNLAATTIAGGFGMLYGTAKAQYSGRMADIWDNEIMQKLDAYNNEVDQNFLPNYYSNKETNASWYSTDNWFTTNFLFDKLVKNSGYAVGAMVSGNIANSFLGGAGAVAGSVAAESAILAESSQAFRIFTPLLRNTARAFSSGKNIEAAGILEAELSSIADVTARSSQLAKIAKTTNQFAGFNDATRRTAISIYSSAGEASFEALQTSNEYRNKLISQYEKDNGITPTGSELEQINQEADRVGKTSFLGNMALLSVTEYTQLPYLMGSSYSASKQTANSLMGRADDVLLSEGKYIAKGGPVTRFGKLLDKGKQYGRYVFDPKEAGQEIGQYALQIGTQNYFDKASRTQDADVWVDGFVYGFTGENKDGEGVGALNSKGGIESGITGGLMQARSNFRGDRAIKANTGRFIDQLNTTPSFKDSFTDRLNSANRGIILQQEQQQAILEGDRLEAEDIRTDITHNYLSSRIKYGRFDMVMDDINELL